MKGVGGSSLRQRQFREGDGSECSVYLASPATLSPSYVYEEGKAERLPLRPPLAQISFFVARALMQIYVNGC